MQRYTCVADCGLGGNTLSTHSPGVTAVTVRSSALAVFS